MTTQKTETWSKIQVFSFQEQTSEFVKSIYISLKNFCWGLGKEGVRVRVMWKVFAFRIKISCLIVLKIESKVLNYAELEGCEHGLGRLAVT